MKLIDSQRWRDIKAPGQADAFTKVRAIADHPLDFLIGKDHERRFIFIFECNAISGDVFDLPKVSGINIVFNPVESSKSQLVLILQDTEQFEIFRILCCDLIDATKQFKTDNEAANIAKIIVRIKRWQSLLKKTKEQLLDSAKQIGLIGELRFLSEFMFNLFEDTTAVEAWRGPYGDEQDFSINGYIFEVKTQLVTSDEYLQINSEAQLDDTSGDIIIVHQTIEVGSEEADDTTSLNQLIEKIRDLLRNTPSAIDKLDMGLLEWGYIKRDEYDEPLYCLRNRKYFEVTEDFPKITSSSLPAGIDNVRYRISMTDCETFEIEEQSVIENLKVV